MPGSIKNQAKASCAEIKLYSVVKEETLYLGGNNNIDAYACT